MPTLTAGDLNARTAALVGVDMDELIESVRLASIAHGHQRAKVDHMEDYRKAKLYSIIEGRRHEIEEAGMKATEAKLESMARASQEYRDYLKRQYDEKVKLVTLEADYYALRNKLEAVQQQLKLIRSEMYFTGQS